MNAMSAGMIQGGELDSKSDCGEFDSHPVCQKDPE